MALRNVTRSQFFSFGFRQMSSERKFVDFSIDKSGISVLSLKRPPVNSLNTEVFDEISAVLSEAGDNQVRGLIVTSKADGVFSAGNDFLEYYQPDPDRLRRFSSTGLDTWFKLYTSSYPTVALINGHAVGSACFLVMACEFRVMTKNFTIGLNETQLGFPVPGSHIIAMADIIGQKETERAVTMGKMYTTDEALKISLVDKAVGNTEEGLMKAHEFLDKFKRILPTSRNLTKRFVRGQTIERFIKMRQDELDQFTGIVLQPDTQKQLGDYIKILKSKSKND